MEVEEDEGGLDPIALVTGIAYGLHSCLVARVIQTAERDGVACGAGLLPLRVGDLLVFNVETCGGASPGQSGFISVGGDCEILGLLAKRAEVQLDAVFYV